MRKPSCGVRSAFGTGPLVTIAPVTTFDDWAVANQLTQLDIVKIDVEGCEAAVLREGVRDMPTNAPTAVQRVRTHRAQERDTRGRGSD